MALPDPEADLTETPATKVVCEQKVVSYSLAIVDSQKNIIFEQTEADETNALELFFDALDAAEEKIREMCAVPAAMLITDEENAAFFRAKTCYMCNLDFSSAEDPPVRDHCHVFGNYLGASHRSCNLRRREQWQIPLFCHNFSGFDSHFIVKGLAYRHVRRLRVMAYNTEKLRTLSFNMFKLLDSCHFITSSLESIVQDMRESGHQFDFLRLCGLANTDYKYELLTKKGIFPYEAFVSVEKFEQLKTLPDISAFESKLNKSVLSQEDYQHAKKVYNEFKFENMLQYALFYNKLDVFLLIEVITSMRDIAYQAFKLDLTSFISLPQMALQCMLRYTKVKLELLTDVDKMLFVEQAIRGGVSFVSNRLVEHAANLQIAYLDATNLVSIFYIY